MHAVHVLYPASLESVADRTAAGGVDRELRDRRVAEVMSPDGVGAHAHTELPSGGTLTSYALET